MRPAAGRLGVGALNQQIPSLAQKLAGIYSIQALRDEVACSRRTSLGLLWRTSINAVLSVGEALSAIRLPLFHHLTGFVIS